MSNISQLEFLNFHHNSPAKAAPRSRLSKAILAAAVVLLVGGSYYLGGSSVKTTNHKDLFSPRTGSSPVGRAYHWRTTSLIKKLYKKHHAKTLIEKFIEIQGADHFALTAQPYKKNGAKDPTEIDVVEGATFGIKLKLEKGPGKLAADKIDFERVNHEDDKGKTHWVWASGGLTTKGDIKALREGRIAITAWLKGAQFEGCPNELEGQLKISKDLKKEKIRNQNMGIIVILVDKKCGLDARLVDTAEE